MINYIFFNGMKFLKIVLLITFTSLATSEEYQMTYNSDVNIFQIESNQESWGTIQEGPFNEYHVRDASENFLALAKMQGDYHFAKFDLFDSNYSLIGIIAQNARWPNRTFEIFLPSREKIATAKMNYWDTKLKITAEEDAHVIARLTRSHFGKNWTIQIEDSDAIFLNNSLFYTIITLTAFQPYYDFHHRLNVADVILRTITHPRMDVSENLYSPEEDFD